MKHHDTGLICAIDDRVWLMCDPPDPATRRDGLPPAPDRALPMTEHDPEPPRKDLDNRLTR